jgi:hypothetical protein
MDLGPMPARRPAATRRFHLPFSRIPAKIPRNRTEHRRNIGVFAVMKLSIRIALILLLACAWMMAETMVLAPRAMAQGSGVPGVNEVFAQGGGRGRGRGRGRGQQTEGGEQGAQPGGRGVQSAGAGQGEGNQGVGGGFGGRFGAGGAGTGGGGGRGRGRGGRGRGQTQQLTPEERVRQIFDDNDQNKDRMLQADEVGRLGRLVLGADRDNDGVITVDELTTFFSNTQAFAGVALPGVIGAGAPPQANNNSTDGQPSGERGERGGRGRRGGRGGDESGDGERGGNRNSSENDRNNNERNNDRSNNDRNSNERNNNDRNNGDRGRGGRNNEPEIPRAQTLMPPGTAYRLNAAKQPAASGNLPEFFASRDANADGQVALSEFLAGNVTERRVSEFRQYDLDGNGFVTRDEAIKAGN